jgi:hypothetical protein
MPTSRRLALSCALFVLALPLPARADPVSVTSGDIQVETSLLLARIALAGPGFSLTTAAEAFSPDVRFCFPCDPSTTTLGATWPGVGARGGSATVNGVHYDQVFFGPGTGGTFTTSAVTIPGSEAFVATLPFTFAGTVTGFASLALDDPLFTVSLTGHGIARAAFAPLVDSDGPFFNSVTLPGADFQLQYVFSDVAATPEPGTLLLLASGAIIGEVRRRTRHTRHAG